MTAHMNQSFLHLFKHVKVMLCQGPVKHTLTDGFQKIGHNPDRPYTIAQVAPYRKDSY